MSSNSQLLLLFFFLITIVQFSTSTKFTATFFFGDSTIDTGNNNFIPTPFRASHAPYGLSLANRGPSGRFSDGLLVSDLLTSSLNIKPYSPPYLDPDLPDQEILTGVNFASAGSGYDDLTSAVSNTAPVSRQLKMFEEFLGRLEGVAGEEGRRRIVEGGLVMFSAGGNDMIFNYYDLYWRREQFNVSGYQNFLHGILMDAVKSVYNHGGRNFIVAGLPPIGCLPLQITASKNALHRKCVAHQISETIAYNTKLQNVLPQLQQSLPGSKIAYLDITDNVIEIIKNPQKYGFEETGKGCCGTGLMEVGPLCNIFTPVCENISSFVFFDAIHPTERIYKIVTDHIITNVVPQFY